MKNILIVGAGGFIGAVLRYKLGGIILHHTANLKFPVSTFAVNVVGCLIAGVLMGMAVKHNDFSQTVRLLLFTGILGGFTTFSAFGVETITLVLEHHLAWAAANVVATVCAGLFALWLGMAVVR